MFLELAYKYYMPLRKSRGPEKLPPPPPVISQGQRFPLDSSIPSLPSTILPAPVRIEHDYFKMKPMAKMTTPNQMTLEICFRYQPEADEGFETNMVILKIQFPSGFVFHTKDRDSLEQNDIISRIEPHEPAAEIFVYFEKLKDTWEECISVVVTKIQEVSSLKPSLIEMYDYYEKKRRSSVTYELQK